MIKYSGHLAQSLAPSNCLMNGTNIFCILFLLFLDESDMLAFQVALHLPVFLSHPIIILSALQLNFR